MRCAPPPRCAPRARFCACACAALLTLLCASALMTLRMFPPSSLQHAAVRYAASFLGLGWCEPVPLARDEAEWAGADGPALNWTGDADFWRAFPCGRERYRVWLPEGGGGAPDAGAPRCRSLTVTAFFDIGRARWLPPFTRSVEHYLANADVVVATRNPMVIFTSAAIGEGLVAKRRDLGLMDRTLVVGMPLECAPEAWTERAARAVMCREGEWAGNIYLGTPERQHP